MWCGNLHSLKLTVDSSPLNSWMVGSDDPASFWGGRGVEAPFSGVDFRLAVSFRGRCMMVWELG